MRGPRCGYCKPTARKPKESVKMTILPMGEVHSQLCSGCDKRINPGERCYAAHDFPGIWHPECQNRISPRHSRDGVESVVVGSPVESLTAVA